MAENKQRPTLKPTQPSNDKAIETFINRGGRSGAQRDFDAVIRRAASQAERPKPHRK